MALVTVEGGRILYVGRITKSGGYPGGDPKECRGIVGFYGASDIAGGEYQGFGLVGCFYSDRVAAVEGTCHVWVLR